MFFLIILFPCACQDIDEPDETPLEHRLELQSCAIKDSSLDINPDFKNNPSAPFRAGFFHSTCIEWENTKDEATFQFAIVRSSRASSFFTESDVFTYPYMGFYQFMLVDKENICTVYIPFITAKDRQQDILQIPKENLDLMGTHSAQRRCEIFYSLHVCFSFFDIETSSIHNEFQLNICALMNKLFLENKKREVWQQEYLNFKKDKDDSFFKKFMPVRYYS